MEFFKGMLQLAVGVVVLTAVLCGLGSLVNSAHEDRIRNVSSWYVTEVVDVETGSVTKEYFAPLGYHPVWRGGSSFKVGNDVYPLARYRTSTRRAPRGRRE